jgi:uncharacterized protein YecT (DUF1311 family)
MYKLFAALLFLALPAFPCVTQVPAQGNTASPTGNPGDIPCDQRQTQLDMKQCSAELYEKSDTQLNALYSKLVERFQKRISHAAQQKDAGQQTYELRGLSSLRQPQRAWIQYRDAHCAAARQRYEGGTIAPVVISLCMAEVTGHLVQELNHTYDFDQDK